jgi:hypothetical protein
MADRIRTIRAALFRARCRIHNRVLDTLAVLAGYCNHRPWSPIPGEGGGYAHWRCGRKRGHVEMHRSRNYVWNSDGRTTYAPVPVRGVDEMGPGWAAQRWDRHLIPTLRQARARDRWHDEQLTSRRAKRQADDA